MDEVTARQNDQLQEENKRLRTTLSIERKQLKQQIEQMQREVVECAAKLHGVSERQQAKSKRELDTAKTPLCRDSWSQTEAAVPTVTELRKWESATEADIPAITEEVDYLIAVIARLRKERSAKAKTRNGSAAEGTPRPTKFEGI